MAERAKASKKSVKSGNKTGSRGRVASPGSGHNSGGPTDEMYLRHWEKIESTAKAMEKAKEAYDQAKGVHQAAYKTAKGDGCDVDAIRALRALHRQDEGVVRMLYGNMARVARVVGSPYGPGQLDLFSGLEEPVSPKVDAHLQGLMAGKNGEPQHNNPFIPGSEDYQLWSAGYMAGQKAIADSMATSGNA